LLWVGGRAGKGLVGEGDVDCVAFDDAVAGGWGLGYDCAYGGDRMRDGLGGGGCGCAGWGLWGDGSGV